MHMEWKHIKNFKHPVIVKFNKFPTIEKMARKAFASIERERDIMGVKYIGVILERNCYYVIRQLAGRARSNHGTSESENFLSLET